MAKGQICKDFPVVEVAARPLVPSQQSIDSHGRGASAENQITFCTIDSIKKKRSKCSAKNIVEKHSKIFSKPKMQLSLHKIF